MKKILFFLILACTLEARIVESENNVDLIIEEKTNSDEYFVYNRNDFPIKFSIQLTEAFNAKDKLIKHTIVIAPGEKAALGSVAKTDSSLESRWSYKADIMPD